MVAEGVRDDHAHTTFHDFDHAQPPADEPTPQKSDGSRTPQKNGYTLLKQDSLRNSNSPQRQVLDGPAKRRVVGEWIQALTGHSLAVATDHDFRQALKSGVILCQIINGIFPGRIPKVFDIPHAAASPGHRAQAMQNVLNFLGVASELRLPTTSVFSMADLQTDGWEERPRVVDCLLSLKQLAEANAQALAPPSPPPLQAAAAAATSVFAQAARSGLPRALLPGAGAGGAAAVAAAAAAAAAPGGVSRGVIGGLEQLAGLPRSDSPCLPRQGSPVVSLTASLDLDQPPRAASPLGDGPLVRRTAAPTVGGVGGVGGTSIFGGLLGGGSSLMHGLGGLGGDRLDHLALSAGTSKLLNHCTAVLRDRSTYQEGRRSAQRDLREAEGEAQTQSAKYIESMLQTIIQEYEKKLTVKDQEAAGARQAAARSEQEISALRQEVAQLRDVLEQQNAAALGAAAAEATEQSESLRQDNERLQQLLHAREARLEMLEQRWQNQNVEADQRYVQLEAELEESRQRMEYLLGLEANYRGIQDENRRLYNQVQDLRGNIRVFCRIRPPGLTGDSGPSCVDVGMDGDMALYDPARADKKSVFKFDRVFDPSCDQVAVYEDTQPLIRSVLDGYNVCIFAYGQTGSGKTHTMAGTHVELEGGRGINYRALDDLFDLRDQRSNEVDYSIRCQMLEIYNESLRDLLVDPSGAVGGNGGGPGNPSKLDILSTQASGCNVPAATQLEVKNTVQVFNLMARGARNRHTSETKMNDRSSRSHQILTVIVDSHNRVTGARSHGCLHLVDLAGSERVGKSEAAGERLREAQHINKSLSALGDVMAALASKSSHIPFRNSKLTQLLQDSLSGQAKVMMFMHVSPEASMHAESISTLQFATRVAEITLGQARKNVESGKVFEAHEEMAKMRAARDCKAAEAEDLAGRLAAERADRAALQQENLVLAAQLKEMQMQLDAAKKAAMLASADATASVTTSRALPKLPLGDLQEHDQGGLLHTMPSSSSFRASPFCTPPRSVSPTVTTHTPPSHSTLVTPRTSRGSMTHRGSDALGRHVERTRSARVNGQLPPTGPPTATGSPARVVVKEPQTARGPSALQRSRSTSVTSRQSGVFGASKPAATLPAHPREDKQSDVRGSIKNMFSFSSRSGAQTARMRS